jgi:hypothetical protein
MARKATVVRTETTTDDAEEGGKVDENESVALFSDLGTTDDDRIFKLYVTREDPDEGFLGTLEPNATEAELSAQWGGSKYTVVAKNARGRIVTRRTLKLGGEPIFMSEVAEMRWRRANGLKPKKAEEAASEGAYSAKELMAIIEAKAEAARVESETREEKRRREDAEREEKLRREEREWRERLEREKAEREERIRREDREHAARMEEKRREDERQRESRIREDEARREKDHERQMAAAAAQAKESQEKSQQFFTNMLAMAKAGDKAGADPMAQVTQILTIVEALKGAGGAGEPQDAVTALLSRLPETLQAAGGMVGNAIREAKGLPAKGAGEGGEDGEGGDLEPGAIKLTGPAATKVRELVTHLISKGQDPEKVLVAAADYLMGKRPNAAVAAARAVQARQPQAKPAQGKAKPVKRRAKARTAPAAKAPPPKSPVPVPAAKPAGAP